MTDDHSVTHMRLYYFGEISSISKEVKRNSQVKLSKVASSPLGYEIFRYYIAVPHLLHHMFDGYFL